MILINGKKEQFSPHEQTQVHKINFLTNNNKFNEVKIT